MRRVLAGAAACVAAMTLIALPAHAQRRASIGFAAGATVPLSDLGDATSTGFHVLGTLAVSGTASSPIGLRIDGMYNNLSGKSAGPDFTIWTVNGNLVYAIPGSVAPYFIGGAGWYNYKADQDGAESNNDIGVNGGIGARFALSGFSTFAEIRYHHIFSDPEAAKVIPITFGIMF